MARSADLIQADLDRAYASRSAALQAQSYSVDSGQGSQSVTRAKLTEIQSIITALEAEYESATDGGAVYLRMDR